MQCRLYAYLRYRKNVKCTSGLTRYVNFCKITIILPSCQPFTLALILESNTINHLDLPSDNFDNDIMIVSSQIYKKWYR